jgi:glycosyltransferase AglD
MKNKKRLIRIISLLLIMVFFVLSFHFLDFSQLWHNSKVFFMEEPELLIIITICYFSSFLLRAIAWKIYLKNQVRLRHCLQGILVSLFINHITPIKLGDIVRIGILTKKSNQVSLDEVTHSVVMMRLLDVLTLVLITLVGLGINGKEIIFRIPILFLIVTLMAGILTLGFICKWLPLLYEKHIMLLKSRVFSKNFLIIIPLVILSWIFEGSVIWGVMTSMDEKLSIVDAVWINSITVGGQVFQITPGGITTYESIMSIALGMIGVPMMQAYQIAFISHAYKFLFSYAMGFLLLLQAPIQKWKEMKELLASKGR